MITGIMDRAADEFNSKVKGYQLKLDSFAIDVPQIFMMWSNFTMPFPSCRHYLKQKGRLKVILSVRFLMSRRF